MRPRSTRALWAAFALAVGGVVSWAAQPIPVQFEGQMVLRARPQTAGHQLAVARIAQEVWNCRVGPGPIDIQVTPEGRAALDGLGVPYDVLVKDVPALLEAEQAQIVEARLQRDASFFTTYRTLAEIDAKLDALAAAAPTLASTFTIGNSFQARPIRGIRISAPDLAGNPRSARPAVLFNGTQHAREWISPATNMYIADSLVEGYGVDPRITTVLQTTEIIVIPVVNPDGYAFTWQSPGGNRLWRKNRRANAGGTIGVDLNRNWSFGWGGLGASTTPSSDTYRGPSPFSEPESAAMRDFISGEPRIRATIDFHSYSQLILSPWGNIPDLPPEAVLFDDLNAQLVASIASVNGLVYRAGPTYETIYPASGGALDWSYGARGLLGLSIELRDLGENGFILPADQIVPTGQENLAAALTLAEFVTPSLLYTLPDGVPEVVDTQIGATFRVSAVPGSRTRAANPVLHARVGLSGPFTPVAMSPQAGAVFAAALPAVACNGVIEYYVETPLFGGGVARFPEGAALFSSRGVGILAGYADNMESNSGWTVGAPGDAAIRGLWERAVPQATAAQPGADASDPGTQCWITGAAAGSSLGDNDVDGGSTTLTGPVFSALPALPTNVRETRLSYARWFSDNQGAAPNEDILTVSLSNDGGATWIPIEAVGEDAGVWVRRAFVIEDILSPTAAMRLRFVATDRQSGSIVEAGVDDVAVEVIGCEPTLDFDGDGDAGTDADIEAYFAVLGGAPCPTGTCASLDFDTDGDAGTDADIQAFFLAIGGG